MTGVRVLLLACVALILTQAIIADDSTVQEGKTKTHVPAGEEAAEEDLANTYKDPLLDAASKRIGKLVDTVGSFLNEGAKLLSPGDEDYILPNDNDGKDAIAEANKLIKFNVPSTMGEGFPDAAPPPSPNKEPVVEEWRNPAFTHKSDGDKTLKRKSRGARKVKSYSVSPEGQFKFNNPSDEKELVRRKRSHLGAGMPDEFEFTLEALSPFDSDPANFKIGSVIPYRLTIHASHVETDVQLEIFSEISGGAFFMVSNVRLGSVGGNFPGYDINDLTIRYDSKFKDGRMDYATVDMGKILNDQSDAATDSESKVEVLFEVQALLHDSLTVGEVYRVSVGAMYDSQSYVTIAQDDLTYEDWTAQSNPVDATFSITGPDTLNLGVTGVWTVTAAVHDLYSDISLDVLAPLHLPDVMSIDRISVEEVGENYQYSAVSFENGGNFTRMTFENYGNYGRLNLGTIINKGYHDSDNDIAKNTITFEVALTMLNHTYNDTSPYTVGFTIWKKDMDSVEIMWSAQQSVQAEDTSLPELTTSPEFNWNPSADTVVAGGRFAVLLNMSIPRSSSAKYVFEASVPVNESNAIVNIEGVRMSRIGFNMPHVQYLNFSEPTSEQTDGSNTDFISWDIGAITNTGQRTTSDSSIVQFELQLALTSNVASYYSDGDSIPISLGMKHAEDYYWVGQTSVTLSNSEIEYTGTQVPEFSFTNVMGADAKIYSGSAAVFDLDIIVPAGVDYAPMEMEISTAVNLTDGRSKLRIVSMELAHVGSALVLDGESGFNLFSTGVDNTTDSNQNPIHTSGNFTIARVTSLRDENFGRYSWEDSTIRIRTIVVARTDDHASLMDEGTYWTETTVSFDEMYIYAARAGIVYNSTIDDPYTVVSGEIAPWQPYKYVTQMSTDTAVVPLGGPAVYNVTIGVPYRTVTDIDVEIKSSNDAIQICRVRFLNSGSAVVDYDGASYEGDRRNRTDLDSGNYDISENYKPAVTSFSYDYYVGDVRDSNLYYELVVMPNHDASVGTNYTFDTKIDLIYGTHTESFTPELAVMDIEAAVTTLPEVYIDQHSNLSDTINIGGSELFYVDIYVAPQTHHRMSVNIYAPWNSTYYGDYEILEAVVTSAGENLGCFEIRRITYNKTRSRDNASGKDNVINIDLGYVPNLAPIDTETEIEANKIRILAHVAVPMNSTLSAGDEIPVAATIDMSGEHLWVGYINTQVVAEHATDNENITVEPTLVLEASGDTIYDIGEVQQYTGYLIVPPGLSYSQLNIEIFGGRDGDESRMKIYDLAFTSAGDNLKEAENDWEITNDFNIFGVEDRNTLSFGFVRNTDIVRLNTFEEVEPKPEDDIIRFSFTARLYDTQPMDNDRNFNISAYLTYSRPQVVVDAIGNTTVTVVSPDTDNADFDWDVQIIYLPDDIYQDSEMTFRLEISITDAAKRFPSDVVVHYRVPYFNNLETVYNNSAIASEYSGLNDQYSEDSSVGQYGLDFSYAKMRYDYKYYLEFNVTVDPGMVLEPGLGNKHIVIPIDVSYKRENRSQAGTYDEYYLTMKTLAFEMDIPENIEPLGMEDGTIKDCQITASSDDGTSTAVDVRPNADGWVSALDRGPPLYQSEYVQVSFDSKVKFTAITVYPYNDGDAHHITKFRVQYSRLGIRWEYALDAGLETKIFDLSWGGSVDSSTSVTINLGVSTFVAKHIRILPYENAESSYTQKMRFELHGYAWPHGGSISSYTCPSSSGSPSHADRQILAVPDNQELYACTIAEPNGKPYCSGTDDFGANWFAIDDNVMNVYGYDPDTMAVYGLARDGSSCLRTKDSGHTWKQILCSTYDTIKSASSAWVDSVELPYPLDGADSAALMSSYGTELDSSHTWSVSTKALHAYSTDTSGVGSKTADEEQVAYWGNKVWGGP